MCLFTCASTHTVHLELTRGLGVQDFLLAFRRFTSRRGLPANLQSDNAKTFKSSSKDIRKLVRSPEVWRYLTNNQISWNFIVERAPWWGGYWERFVCSVKSPIQKSIGISTLTHEELSTLLNEIEGLINARPLTYVYDNEESISYPLTPSDLIYGRRVTATQNSQHFEITSTYDSLTKRLKTSYTSIGTIHLSMEKWIFNQFKRTCYQKRTAKGRQWRYRGQGWRHCYSQKWQRSSKLLEACESRRIAPGPRWKGANSFS